ncbi:hypothetical protein BDW67DRAFT_187213 [Aspergillus spinulosporus]
MASTWITPTSSFSGSTLILQKDLPPYFNIIEPDPTSTDTDNATLSTASSNATSTTSSTSSPVITDPSISSLPQAADISEPGLTTTAKVALDVGLGVGLPILGALAVLIWQRSRTNSGIQKGDNASPPSCAAELLGGITRQTSSRSAKEVPGTDPAHIPRAAGSTGHLDI